MPFVHKDANGKIIAVYTEPVEGGVEVGPSDPALIDFIQQNIPTTDTGEDWTRSDRGLTRVIEDLIDVLIEKKVVLFTDFPEGAQKKLLERRGRRKEFDLVEDLFGDDFEAFEGGEGEDSGLL
ncbi:MAG: hypothetical protein IIC06_09670 [Proteobacteria bacterium]|nr:hypothetical protein [Pseudomonadota bacterium]